MNAASGTPTGSFSGPRDRRLERDDGVVREGADGAAGEPRHALGGQDSAPRHEGPQRGERVGHLGRGHREVG